MRKKLLERRTLSLEETSKEFEKWRKSKSKQCPIPEEHWKASVNLFPAHTITEISRALRLSYVDLKNRIEQKVSTDTVATSTPGFIEIGAIKSQMESEWVMELEDKNGSRMKLSFKGKKEFSLVEMARAFWSRGR